MSKIDMKDGRLIVPDCVTVPYIEGDGEGKDADGDSRAQR